jgi:hypothetical protein
MNADDNTAANLKAASHRRERRRADAQRMREMRRVAHQSSRFAANQGT